MTKMAHIAVCVCTFKRPALLERLLEALVDQDTAGLFTHSIVVVDNDFAESAKTVVDAVASDAAVGITYCVEPRQSIPRARNKAAENAEGDFIALIDDDELPPKRWLLTLFKALDESKVDGVLGPVKPQFTDSRPEWVIKGGFYEHPIHRTGRLLDWTDGRLGNVLLTRRLFAGEAQPFGQEFLDGEDQDFFKRMIQKGHGFIWCDEALVHELIPAARWKRGFLVRRALFRGLFSLRNRRSFVLAIAESLIAAPAYAIALPVALLLGQTTFMSCAFRCSYHSGRLMAVLGINPIRRPYVTD